MKLVVKKGRLVDADADSSSNVSKRSSQGSDKVSVTNSSESAPSEPSPKPKARVAKRRRVLVPRKRKFFKAAFGPVMEEQEQLQDQAQKEEQLQEQEEDQPVKKRKERRCRIYERIAEGNKKFEERLEMVVKTGRLNLDDEPVLYAYPTKRKKPKPDPRVNPSTQLWDLFR